MAKMERIRDIAKSIAEQFPYEPPESRRLRALKIGYEARKQRSVEQRAIILPIIEEIRRKRPDVSLRAICRELDQRGISPPRSRTWSPATIYSFLNPKKPEHDD